MRRKLRHSVKQIRGSVAMTEAWSVTADAGTLHRRAIGDVPWLSAEKATEAMSASAAAAEACASDVLRANPHDPMARLLLGGALLSRGRWLEARANPAAP